ncbi:hypothetical protein CDAR_193411 [Caerostris darwini]|uniref:Uncharacterized protein n=1 Tax=Caerostris darwini TaxID=1538125 RepID=A0AAV4TPI2_9ARAC|nr:hypothetical protein CDAR_193411 [Caerostris darwini]
MLITIKKVLSRFFFDAIREDFTPAIRTESIKAFSNFLYNRAKLETKLLVEVNATKEEVRLWGYCVEFQISKQPSQVKFGFPISKQPSQVKFGFPISKQPSQVKFVFPISKQPRQVKFGFPILKQPSQVKFGFPISKQPAQVKFGFRSQSDLFKSNLSF